MCIYFDPHVTRQCREDDAEEVKEKARSNFCDYFRPNPDAHDSRFNEAEAKARANLAGLFGEDSPGASAPGLSDDATGADPLDSAEALFRGGGDQDKD